MLRVALATLAVILAFAACGGSGSANEWIAVGSDGAVFIQWTRNGDSLTGTLSFTRYKPSGGAGQAVHEVESGSVSFTGVIDDSDVTLTLEQGFGLTANWSGTLGGEDLALSYPAEDGTLTTLRFTPSDVAEYNSAVQGLQDDAAQAKAEDEAAQDAAAEKAAIAEQQAAIDSLSATVRDDLTAIEDVAGAADGPLAKASKEFAKTEAALARTRALMAQALAARGDAACSLADETSYAADETSYAADEVHYALDDAENALTDGSAAVARLRANWKELQGLLAGLPDYESPHQPSASEVATADQEAASALQDDRRRIRRYRREAEGFVETADAYVMQADGACY